MRQNCELPGHGHGVSYAERQLWDWETNLYVFMALQNGSSSTGRAGGQVLIVAGEHAQAELRDLAERAGLGAHACGDPYAAVVELLRRPLVFRAVVLSLQNLYREELTIIKTLRTRLPHVDVWLAHTDGRHAAMAEALRLGATGLLSEEGVYRFTDDADEPPILQQRLIEPHQAVPSDDAPHHADTPSEQRAAAPHGGVHFAAGVPLVNGSSHNHSQSHHASNSNQSTSANRSPEAVSTPKSTMDVEPILTAEELRALLQEPTSPEG